MKYPIAFKDMAFANNAFFHYPTSELEKAAKRVADRIDKGLKMSREEIKEDLLALMEQTKATATLEDMEYFKLCLSDEYNKFLSRVYDGSNLVAKLHFNGLHFKFYNNSTMEYACEGDTDFDRLRDFFNVYGVIPIQYPDPEKLDEYNSNVLFQITNSIMDDPRFDSLDFGE